MNCVILTAEKNIKRIIQQEITWLYWLIHHPVLGFFFLLAHPSTGGHYIYTVSATINDSRYDHDIWRECARPSSSFSVFFLIVFSFYISTKECGAWPKAVQRHRGSQSSQHFQLKQQQKQSKKDDVFTLFQPPDSGRLKWDQLKIRDTRGRAEREREEKKTIIIL